MSESGTAARYTAFADGEARGVSPCYEEWARGVAADPVLLGLIDELPTSKRQPNLVFGAARHLGADPGPFDPFRTWLVENWPSVAGVALNRRTQTNEAARDAVLLPLLAALPQPLALIEVGASAGLCLYPDRYSYEYTGHPRLDPADGPSEVVLRCELLAPAPVPAVLPVVSFRAGIDLNPIDPGDETEIAWLESLVWPEHEERRRRIRAAARIAGREPAHVVEGDLNDHLVRLVDSAPAGSTVVVFHSAVLAYLEAADRDRFEATVRSLECVWISNEGPGAVRLDRPLPERAQPRPATFVLAQDGRPVAYAGGHGGWLDWFADEPRS